MIPTLDFGGSGPDLVFAHANGFPPAAYTPLLTRLAEHYHVTALLFRPLWAPGTSSLRPEDLRNWNPCVEDVLQCLTERPARPVIGVGHSLGSVSLLAAALRHPDWFHLLVLLDPVMLAPGRLWLWNLARAAGLAHRMHPLIPGTARRRRRFVSRDEMLNRYRRAPVFARLDDEALGYYVNAVACPDPNGGVTLAYTPEWEVAIYANGPLDLWPTLHRLPIPVLVIRGADSDTFLETAVREFRHRLPGSEIQTVAEAGHLVPMEKPIEVAGRILHFLETRLPNRDGAAAPS